MYRFYIEDSQVEEDNAFIVGDDVNHIKNVLRLTRGDWVVACNGQGKDYVSRISQIDRDRISLHVEKIQDTGTELPVKITLFQGLPKKDKLELIIQKAVELGVYRIVPVKMSRCVVKIDEKKIKNRVERWNLISMSAAKQCDRGIIPEVTKPVTLKEAFDMAVNIPYNMIPYECHEGMRESLDIVAKACRQKEVGIFIGPEGGLEPEEVEEAVGLGIKPITLGKRILRTETAGMALLSIMMFQISGTDPVDN